MTGTPSRLKPPTKIANPFSSKNVNIQASEIIKTSENNLDTLTSTKSKRRKLQDISDEISNEKEHISLKSKNFEPENTASIPKANHPISLKELGLASEAPQRPKRAGWDIKGRLEDMEALTAFLKEKILESNASMDKIMEKLSASELLAKTLAKEKQELSAELLKSTSELEFCVEELERLKNENADLKYNYDKDIKSLNQVNSIERQKLLDQIQNLEENVDNLQNILKERESTISSRERSLEDAKKLLSLSDNNSENYRIELNRLNSLIQDKENSIGKLEKHLKEKEELITQLGKEIMESDSVRRNLLQQVQELKGNIRVYCRVRPLLPSDKEDELSVQQLAFPSHNEIELKTFSESVLDSSKKTSKSISFAFDLVFKPETNQSHVFEEISQLVQSALDGYRVCVFAYGQTGSGKTHTMEGSSSDPGMIPRSVHEIFNSFPNRQKKGWKYAVEASFLEIYNETIRDLLVSPSSSQTPHDLEIRHDAKSQKTSVIDLSTHIVSDPKEVMDLLKKASQSRAVAETHCNARSSRSHSVFILKLLGENILTSEKTEGILNLIDLAGSERLKESGSTGERLKETQAINKSLSSLSDVITALANKDSHIPYRNSKLTYLLQFSLGGNSKTLMFVNVSPASKSINESINSLRFATKVNSTHVGTATKRIVSEQ